MSRSPTVLATVTLALLDGATRRGLPRAPLLRAAGLTEELVAGPDARIPRDADTRLWLEVSRHLEDPELGLSMAERDLSPGAFGVVGLLAMTSATLGDAFARAVRFHRVLKDDIDARISVVSDSVVVEEAPPPTQSPWTRELADFAVASYVVLARRWSGQGVVPREVRFQHARPRNTSGYERVFGCPVRFGHARNGVVLSREQLGARLVTSQAEVAAYLEQLAKAAVARLPRDEDVLGEVRAALHEALARTRDLRLSHIARRLGVGPRTLQRRLAERGVAYQSLVEDVRRAEAMSLVTLSEQPIERIAERLGYAESKAFRRAFRRWTGVAPNELRRDRGAPPQ